MIKYIRTKIKFLMSFGFFFFLFLGMSFGLTKIPEEFVTEYNYIQSTEHNPEYINLKPVLDNKIKRQILNKANNDKYKAIQLALYLNDKIESLKSKYKGTNLERILGYIQFYLKYDLPNELGFIPIKELYVVDGDTIKYYNLINGKKETLRMIGLDTPESNATRFGYTECYGNQAKEHLKKILNFYKYLYVEIDKSQGEVDKYGRRLGYLVGAMQQRCFMPYCAYKINNINGLQIKDGFGWEYTYNKYNPYKYQKLFQEYEQYAKEHNLGLWAKNTCNGQRVALIKEKTSSELMNVLDINDKTKNNQDIPKENELINNQEEKKEQGDKNLSCDNSKKIYCSKLKTCDEAMFYYKKCGLSRLDRDKDGIPCESLCSTR